MTVDSQTDGTPVYVRDTCYCPHPQTSDPNHLYKTDSALRDLILKKNIEYTQNFLQTSAAIYRVPGMICLDERSLNNVFKC